MSEIILKKGGLSTQKTAGQDPLQVLNEVNNNKLLPLLAIMDKAVPIISQILGFKIMKELFDSRDNTKNWRGELPTPLPKINREMVYFMNMISIQQFFQENNDLGRTFASGIMTANYGGNLFHKLAEANISSLWNKVPEWLYEVPEINWDSILNGTWENILAEVKEKFNIGGVPSI